MGYDTVTAQAAHTIPLLTGQAANTDSTNTGRSVAQLAHLLVEVGNPDPAGTATIALQGSFDQVSWYAAGYQQIDGVIAPARSVAALAVAASASHVYQVLDRGYGFLRAVQTASAGFTTGGVTVTVHAQPID